MFCGTYGLTCRSCLDIFQLICIPVGSVLQTRRSMHQDPLRLCGDIVTSGQFFFDRIQDTDGLVKCAADAVIGLDL